MTSGKKTRQSRKNHFLPICICLAAATLAVYWPVYKYEFVEYDDGNYVSGNANVRSGLNFDSIRWAFTTGYGANWHPVTWLSLMLDYQLFENRAGGYHLVNVFFHIANTLILFYVLMRMTGAVWPSAFVAAIFALHPLHVESVAWIAERKDVLSTFFWLLTMWAYIHYVQNSQIKWYFAALILFVLGLMSKPMLVSLPFVLLLLDYWPLQRKISVRLLIEKIPFFIPAIISSIVTFIVQQHGGAVVEIKSSGLITRIDNAVVSYLMYIIKMVWPSHLAVLYPHPGSELSMTRVFGCGLLLILISIFCIYMSRRYRFFAVGWFWFIGTLVPVIGLVQVGPQAMADRYTYIPLTGLFIIIAWGAKEFFPKQRYKLLTLIAVTILTASGIAAARQVRYWETSQTLFEHTLQITKNNYLIHTNYIIYLNKVGKLDKVIEQSYKLLKIKPDSVETRNNLGIALALTGNAREAIEQFRLAIKYEPNNALSYFNLAVTLQNQDKLQEAAVYYKQAIKIQPVYLEACVNLADALVELGKYQDAIEYYNKALAIKPGDVKIKQHIIEARDKQRLDK